MGRWGHAMFEGDMDRDIVYEHEDVVGISMNEKPSKLNEAKEKLDAGLGQKLMQECREKEALPRQRLADPKYSTILLGAYMMHVGATISDYDRRHLMEILPQIPSRSGYTLPMFDLGFRDPGKVQYQAALENYVNGTPRSFFDPSCYHCGKISDDLGGTQLKRCGLCKKHDRSAYHCNQGCQRGNWKTHKKSLCKPLMEGCGGGFVMLNV